MQNRRAAISRRFRFSQPRRRRHDGRPRGGRRRGFAGPIRLRNGRPAAENVAAGRLAGRIPVRDQRPGPASGIAARNGLNEGAEDGPGRRRGSRLERRRGNRGEEKFHAATLRIRAERRQLRNVLCGQRHSGQAASAGQCPASAGRGPAGGRRQPGRCLSWPRRRARGWPRELQEPGKPCCPWRRANRSGRSRSP